MRSAKTALCFSGFSKLVVNPAKRDQALALNPLSERPSLHGVEYIFKDAPQETLKELGEVTIPNLAELFVATVGSPTGEQA